jgi:prophage regulatory protein
LEIPEATRLLRPAVVQEITTLSRSTLWEKVRAGTFPRPLKIHKQRIAWRASEVEAWIASCDSAEAV